MLEVITLVLGPVQTNAYLVADPARQEAVVIDPAWDGEAILAEARRRNWQITGVWVTHAHFDHFGGAAGLIRPLVPPPPLGLHPADLPLWRMGGGAALFGIPIDPAPQPSMELTPGSILHLGSYAFEVRHAPGHTPGHVIFYCESERLAFCGDVIFQGSIGRTDLPGGSYTTLMQSIQTQVLTLPDDTRLYSGHGAPTTVGEERLSNPFLQ